MNKQSNEGNTMDRDNRSNVFFFTSIIVILFPTQVTNNIIANNLILILPTGFISELQVYLRLSFYVVLLHSEIPNHILFF